MADRPGTVESLEMNFWKNKRVFITGHTGFKGSWLSLWLVSLGAKVSGYALKPPTEPSLFELCRVGQLIKSVQGDVRDLAKLTRVMKAARPEIVIHLAAQPIVRESYRVPVGTFEINVMGTVNVLEAARACRSVKAIVNVTTDKVYEARNTKRAVPAGRQVTCNAYKEMDPLGGYDPYSSSKACSELVTQAYRRSYGLNAATARAGNVIGGGDWAADRLIPDFIRSILNEEKYVVRNPKAIRPWQYVLEPLAGYLRLAEKLYRHPGKYAAAWNFGPEKKDGRTVDWIARRLCWLWGRGAAYEISQGQHPHEAGFLLLDAAKARQELGWRPKFKIDQALKKIIVWTRAYAAGLDMREVCLQQIEEYLLTPSASGGHPSP